MATRFYNASGITTNSKRGTAVKKMCKAVAQAAQELGREYGATKLGYENWSNGHENPVGYMRFAQLVSVFLPLYRERKMEAFDIIDTTDMSYTDACLFGEEITGLLGTAKKYGVKVVLQH